MSFRSSPILPVVDKKTRTGSYSAVTAPRPRALDRVDEAADPVLEDVRQVADRVAVREEVPAARAVAVVVEPRAEDEVRGDAEEEAIVPSAWSYGQKCVHACINKKIRGLARLT